MQENRRILVVDDEPSLRRALRTILATHGYEVCDARRSDEAMDLVRSAKFDLILLDVNLPDMTGVEVCKKIRAGFDVPIIMLTVRGDEKDKVTALDAGADDYLVKPFGAFELLARVQAALRRHRVKTGAASDLFECEDFEVDFPGRTVTRGGEKLRLSSKQCQLLRYFVSKRGEILTHRTLLQAIWGPEYGGQTMLLQAVVAQLRKKIESEPHHPKHLLTIPCVGYQFN